MTADELAATLFRRGREERAYWERHYPDLLARYPDEWIAVHEDTVVARALNIWDLVQVLEDQGIDSRDAWITFLNATRRAISL